MASSNLRAVEPSHVGHPRRLKVLWLGPTSQGLGWLHRQMSNYRSASTAAVEVCVMTQGDVSVTSQAVGAQLQPLVEAGAERLVVACCNRLDYPRESIEWLNLHAPELPLAVATDTWWDGARRTGLGGLTHVTLPWHRWWDGWCDWLDATSGDWFGPCVQPASLGLERRPAIAGADSRTAQGKATQGRSTQGRGAHADQPSRGLVVANCRQTAEAWCLVARQAGGDVQWRSAASWREGIRKLGDSDTSHADPPHSDIDWLLWDDSCLTTAGAGDGLAQCLGFLEQARSAQPRAQIFCACSLPRWSEWERMQALGANELLTKPNTGRGLQRLLERS